jgi:uncharacterized damage-inducible protein DinB
MYRNITDFQNMWQFETDATLMCFRNLTDTSLGYRSSAFPRGLGRLAQHIAEAPSAYFSKSRIPVDGPAYGVTPATVDQLIKDYMQGMSAILLEVANWSDGNLEDSIEFFGMPMKKGMLLSTVIHHQAHHRGQLTVLMHEAGVPAPGFYGPTASEQRVRGEEPLP